MAHALPLELVEVLERAAAHPDGPEPLLSGNLECAACLYQVRPERVEQVRDLMRHPALRRLAAQILGRPRAPAAQHELLPPRISDVPSLVLAAMRRPHGMELLMEAPVELAAIQLRAHPFLVDAARRQLDAMPAFEPQQLPLPLTPHHGALAS